MSADLYDKTGRGYEFDHEYDGLAYVRPMVKVLIQTSNYHGDDFSEDEDLEPADYLIAMNRADLFDKPPVAPLNEDIAAKQAELAAVKSEHARAVHEKKLACERLDRQLESTQRRLDQWMKDHQVMIDLGRLLDGEVLYPLSLKERTNEIPRIPSMKDLRYLTVHSGDFEKGKPWTCEKYNRDSFGTPFRFFDTEEERLKVIRESFDSVCASFRKKPDFAERGYSSNLNYGYLKRWVETHPALEIPEDIREMKRQHEAEIVEQRKAKLAAELAALEEKT
ncbi:MAG: hypothetical protein RIA09_16025 [Hoeflea sp.]|jgi:hypothetical protein|uniref:hypothetical protein n=1 Tax=Hoeflea sp. TaxID=1940281 RepID=UPI0032EEDFD0